MAIPARQRTASWVLLLIFSVTLFLAMSACGGGSSSAGSLAAGVVERVVPGGAAAPEVVAARVEAAVRAARVVEAAVALATE